MTREITISRSAVPDCAGASRPVTAIGHSSCLCLLEVLHVRVQPVEALVPEPLEPACPLVDRSQPAGVKAVQALLACLAVPHQPDLPEHPQVLGRPRLGHPQLLGHLGHRPLTRPQQDQDRPALRLGDRVEDVRRRRCSCHGAIICRYRYASRRKSGAVKHLDTGRTSSRFDAHMRPVVDGPCRPSPR